MLLVFSSLTMICCQKSWLFHLMLDSDSLQAHLSLFPLCPTSEQAQKTWVQLPFVPVGNLNPTSLNLAWEAKSQLCPLITIKTEASLFFRGLLISFLCVYPAWHLSSFLNLWVDISHKTWKNAEPFSLQWLILPALGFYRETEPIRYVYYIYTFSLYRYISMDIRFI